METDYINRADAIQALVSITAYNSVEEIQAACFDSYARTKGWLGGVMESITALAEGVPAADVRPVVYCKDCIHRPYETVPGVRYGLTVESPDSEYKCPCFCDGDGWYSYIPDDDFFCGNGERLRDGGTP